jgi:Immunity protein 26
MTKPQKRAKSKRIVAGDVIKIPLGDGDGTHTYARVFPGASYGFYDWLATEELPIEQVIRLPILFFAAVMDSAVNEGRWPIVGHVPLDDRIVPPPKFIQDPLNSNSFSIYLNSGEIIQATREECLGLERSAVWYPEHMEDRLRDQYAGRENKWVELLKMR